MEIEKVQRSEAEWLELLGSKRFKVLREGATDPAFQGELTDEERPGIYSCAGCELPLFHATTKFHSGCGWPSFFSPIESKHIILISDRSFGMVRVEVRCAKCQGHLGHVFTGEGFATPTDERWCINSSSLVFKPA
jgi:peptide-methionine (R)-S-oxide reductase